MPGMMDTILNLGLNEETVQGLANKSNNPRFAWDSYRRFIQLFGKVVFGVDDKKFNEVLDHAKKNQAVQAATLVESAVRNKQGRRLTWHGEMRWVCPSQESRSLRTWMRTLAAQRGINRWVTAQTTVAFVRALRVPESFDATVIELPPVSCSR